MKQFMCSMGGKKRQQRRQQQATNSKANAKTRPYTTGMVNGKNVATNNPMANKKKKEIVVKGKKGTDGWCVWKTKVYEKEFLLKINYARKSFNAIMFYPRTMCIEHMNLLYVMQTR